MIRNTISKIVDNEHSIKIVYTLAFYSWMLVILLMVDFQEHVPAQGVPINKDNEIWEYETPDAAPDYTNDCWDETDDCGDWFI